MSVETIRRSEWNKEIEDLGLRACLRERARFHGGLHIADAVICTGAARSTILRHFKAIVESGNAVFDREGHDHIRSIYKD